MSARTLHVRCATWEQVEVFLTRKLRKGRLLSMKVPFPATQGTIVTLGLELPNQLVIAIDGNVQRASAVEGDSSRTWIEIELTGLTEEVLQRVRTLMASGGEEEPETDPQIHAVAPVRKSSTSIADDLPADERELFQHLSGELRRMRSAAVHEVLGVTYDAGPEDVRAAWKNLVRRHHPDLVARRSAPAITHLAEELTILANRAYDRLRAALVAEGRASAAGPSVAAPPGWLVGFEDIQSGDRSPAPQKSRTRTTPTSTPRPPAAAPAPAGDGKGGEAFEQRARTMLGAGDAAQAREVLAAALVVYPRSKPLRSLYYVATALAALQSGEVMLAQSQLETALAHHDECVEAAQLLDLIKKQRTDDAEAMRRLFQ